MDRGLVRIMGHRDVPGRPLLYGTARRFLEVFGLDSLKALPSLRELDELAKEQGLASEQGESDEQSEASVQIDAFEASTDAQESADVLVEEGEEVNLPAEDYDLDSEDEDASDAPQ